MSWRASRSRSWTNESKYLAFYIIFFNRPDDRLGSAGPFQFNLKNHLPAHQIYHFLVGGNALSFAGVQLLNFPLT